MGINFFLLKMRAAQSCFHTKQQKEVPKTD